MLFQTFGNPSVARFLNDPSPLLADEAARAINDAFIEPAMPQLAAALTKPKPTRPVWLRAINANLRLGTPEIVRWGMTAADMPELAALIVRGLRSNEPSEVIAAVVTGFRRRFTKLHFVN